MPDQDPSTLPPLLYTPEQRLQWWDSMDSHWKDAFITGFLGRPSGSHITDQDLRAIAHSPTLRFVGPRGMYSNMSGPLENLIPLAPLANLTYLFVTFCALQSLEGLKDLARVKSLFINNNQIKSLEAVAGLPVLEELYCNDNQITSLFPLQHCHQLRTIQCQYNALTNFRGMTRIHAQKLQRFLCLPNDGIGMAEIQRTEKMGIICSKE